MRLSKMRVTGTNFRITDCMSREDRKTNLDFYLKERQTNFTNHEAVMDFIETEIEVTKNTNNQEYLQMIQKMEEELA